MLSMINDDATDDGWRVACGGPTMKRMLRMLAITVMATKTTTLSLPVVVVVVIAEVMLATTVG